MRRTWAPVAAQKLREHEASLQVEIDALGFPDASELFEGELLEALQQQAALSQANTHMWKWQKEVVVALCQSLEMARVPNGILSSNTVSLAFQCLNCNCPMLK